MKRGRKSILKRGMAMFLVFVMCVGLLPMNAFAAEEPVATEETVGEVVEGNPVEADEAGDDIDDTNEGETPTDEGESKAEAPEPSTEQSSEATAEESSESSEAEVRTISTNEGAALIPTDATVESSESTETDPANGDTTTTITTDTEWGKTTTETGEYGDKTLSGDTEKVDQLLGGENLDEIPDGITYTKKEEQEKTDVKTEVEGNQTQTESSTVDANGNLIGDSFEVGGEQKTTTTSTTTKDTTITEATKQTTEKKLDDDKVVSESDPTITKGPITEITDNKKDVTERQATADELDEVSVTLGGDLFIENTITSGELTVSGNKNVAPKEATSTGVATSTNDANVTRDLLKALEGWTVKSNGVEATIKKVDENGKVTYVDADGKVITDFEIRLVGENGTYSIQATKITTIPTDDSSFEEEITSSKYSEVESSKDKIAWDDKYELVETIEEEGYKIQRYCKKGTVNRTDTKEWTEIKTYTDGRKEVTQTATVSATLTNGNYTIEAKWGDVKDNSDDSDVLVKVLGPSGTVIGYAIKARNASGLDAQKEAILEHHLILTNKSDILGQGSSGLAAGNSNGAHVGGLTLAGGHDGEVLESTINIIDANGGGWGAWLRRLSDGNGGYFYVYCAEHGKGTSNEEKYELVNVDEHAHYGDKAAQIQYIVENGWWGTNNGAGSLTQVKTLVSSTHAQYLDEGIALAVTQAAIWYYTSSEKVNGVDRSIDPSSDIFTTTWTRANGNSTESLTGNQKKAAMALFDALINGDVSENKKTTDLIRESDVTSTSIQVVEQVDVKNVAELTQLVRESLEAKKALATTDEEREAVEKEIEKEVKKSVNALQGDVYKTNVSVTLAVVPSRLNSDDLMVYVYSGDVIVGSKRVDKATLQKGSGKVTIENVVLQSGQNVKFQLEGTQYLAKGAYLFSTEIESGETSSQTMIGYVSNKAQGHKVDLEVNMSFKVDVTQTSTKQSATVTGDTKDYKETRTVTTEKSSDVEVKETHEKTVLVTTTVKNTSEKESNTVIEAVKWGDEGSNTYVTEGDDDDDDDDRIIEGDDDDDDDDGDDDDDDDEGVREGDDDDDDIPDNNVPQSGGRVPNRTTGGTTPQTNIFDEEVPLANIVDEEVPLASIPDEEVPLAALPKTGDLAGMWHMMAALSAVGLALMSHGKKKEEEI